MPTGHGCPGFHVESSSMTFSSGGIAPATDFFRASSATAASATLAFSLACTCAWCLARCDAAKCSSCGAGGTMPYRGAPGSYPAGANVVYEMRRA